MTATRAIDVMERRIQAESAMESALARSDAHEAAGRFGEAVSEELAAVAHFNAALRLKDEFYAEDAQ
jgi:hypothetical protein